MEEKRIIEIKPFNENWKKEYKKEAKKLLEIFGSLTNRIEHIGSTAIPGMKAKPIIDILIIVNDLSKVDALNNAMKTIGYTPMFEYGIKNRRFFLKGKINRTHHVHVFEYPHEHVTNHLLFREYLINHPAEAQKYAILKESLAKKYPHEIEQYMAGKNHFIKDIIEKANEENISIDL